MGRHALKRYPWYTQVPWPEDIPLWMLAALFLASLGTLGWGLVGIAMEVF